jgi:uncharacterized radical SAM superfamily protein
MDIFHLRRETMSGNEYEIKRIAEDLLGDPRHRDHFEAAWRITRENHPPRFTFYLPGMIRYGRERGKYPAVSITGDHCDLLCEHCRGKLLDPMIKAPDPETLIRKCRQLHGQGVRGVLLSGGSDNRGRLPWEPFLRAIREIKRETGLFLSAHTGFPAPETALKLKQAGLDQALVDVMGDDETAREVYHLSSLETVRASLSGLTQSGLEVVPHILAGLYFGEMRAEHRALEWVARSQAAALVIVVLTPMKDTPMARLAPPDPLEVAGFIAEARIMMPKIPIALGCERPRNRDGERLERLAILAGANRMAVWSEGAVATARSLGLKPRFQPTCCSVPCRETFAINRRISNIQHRPAE